MFVLNEKTCSSKILQDRYLAKLTAHRRISFAICYITFKARINIKDHMKRVAHVLATGPAGVEGGFVGELMLLLDGISVTGQRTRKREVSPLKCL